MRHAKKQWIILHTQGKQQPKEHVPKGAIIWELIDKDFKLAIIHIFKELKETIYVELKERMRTMSYKIETINRDKNHKEELNRKSGVKSITTEMKSTFWGVLQQVWAGRREGWNWW